MFLQKSDLKGYFQKSSRMHVKKSLFGYKMFHNLKKYKSYEQRFSEQV